MPKPHSILFKLLTNTSDRPNSSTAPVSFKPETDLKKLIVTGDLPDGRANGDSIFDELADLLKEMNDAQFGIVSTLNDDGEWVRDATSSIPLDKRISHDHPAIEANNALLRALSRLRAIDYAIAQKYKSDPEAGNVIRRQLKQKLGDLTFEMIQAGQNPDQKAALERIKNLEKEFDTSLVQALHDANLTKGVSNEKKAQKLLFHYRNLSSLMVPARTMITLTYDEQAKVLQRETQYPVTKKTPHQKKTMEELRDLNPSPLKQDKTAHTSQPLAMQEADALFVDLMKQDDRALPAQTRKSHLVGAKNAFIVKNELFFDIDNPDDVASDTQAEEEDILWLARTGVPVYVGEGEDTRTHLPNNYMTKVQRHTRENITQIRETAQQLMGEGYLNIHITTLNTDTPLENQSTMINHLYAATRRTKSNGDDISYAPTNIDGTFRFLDVSKSIYGESKRRPWGSAPLDKKWRVETVADIMLEAQKKPVTKPKERKKPKTLSLVNCASGQDRTGTAVEKATQVWTQRRYHAKGKRTDNIETMRAKGGNAAEITTHHVHGSPGMKEESQAGKTFSPKASKQFYRKSATTNKKNPVGNVDFLKKPSKAAAFEFLNNRNAFIQALRDLDSKPDKDEKTKAVIQRGLDVLTQVDDISEMYSKDRIVKMKPANKDAIEHIQTHLEAKGLADLNSAMVYSKNALNKDMNPQEHAQNARKMAGLSKSISGKSSSIWKALGVGLLFFAAAALVAVGVLAAVPTGGSSLVLAAIGGAGIAAATAAAAGGVASINRGREKGLAHSVRLFKESVNKLQEEEHVDEDISHSSGPGRK